MEPYNDPPWLNIMQLDAAREGLVAQILGEFTLGAKCRAVIKSISNWFRCDDLGAMNQTVRVFERYMSGVVQLGYYGNDASSVWLRLKQRQVLFAACCFLLASKTLKLTIPVTPEQIYRFLVNFGTKYSIQDVIFTEREIFTRIGYHLPYCSNIYMAELLAAEVGMPPSSLDIVREIVYRAELRRHDLEFEVRLVTGDSGMTECLPRVRTFHLAAGCVAAAAKKIQSCQYDQIALRLTRLLQV